MDEHMDDIFIFAQLLQETIEQTYANSGVSLPDKRYITIGGVATTAHDCEQLTVSWEQAYSGLPGEQAQELVPCNGPVTSVFVIELVRCIPEALNMGKRQARSTPATMLPEATIETRTETAKIQMRDAFLLRDAAMAASDSDLSITQGSLVDASAGQPQGGYQAIIVTVAVAI